MWIALLALVSLAGLALAIGRRLPIGWMLVIALPLCAWVVFNLFQIGKPVHAVVLLGLYAAGIAHRVNQEVRSRPTA